MSEIERHSMENLMPVLVNDKIKMAEILSKSGLMPTTLDTPQKVFIALQMGHELGLSPMVSVNNIAAINGKPVISADLQVAVARKHPDFEGMTISEEKDKCTVTIKRKTNGSVEEFSASFSNDDAATAGLLGKDNWKKYPARMRKHRATSYALRDAFPDALAGVYTKEELEDGRFYDQPKQDKHEERNVTPELPEENSILGKKINSLINEAVHSGTMTAAEGKQWKGDLAESVSDIEKLESLGKNFRAVITKLQEQKQKEQNDLLKDAGLNEAFVGAELEYEPQNEKLFDTEADEKYPMF